MLYIKKRRIVILVLLFIFIFLFYKINDLGKKRHDKNRNELIKLSSRFEELKDNNKYNVEALSVLSEAVSGLKISEFKLKEEKIQLEKVDFFLPYLLNTSLQVSNDPAENSIIKSKKSSYIISYKKNIFIVFWSGKIIRVSLDDVENFRTINKLNFYEVHTNLNSHKDNYDFIQQKNYWNGIKGALVVNGRIYLSYIKEHKKNCFNIGLLSADISDKSIKFSDFFTFKECLDIHNEFTGVQSGGALLDIGNNEILLSVGDFRAYEKSQEINSNFGKIHKINLISKESKIIAMGLRNPQGLVKIGNNIIVSDHGPKKGDEINIFQLEQNKKDKIYNFGWPKSSYGYHYDDKFRKNAPLFKSHKDYGFIEPVYYFDIENHGIGRLEIWENKNNKKNFIALSLSGRNLYIFNLLEDGSVKLIEKFFLNNRLRDIKKIDQNTFLLTSEGIVTTFSILNLKIINDFN